MNSILILSVVIIVMSTFKSQSDASTSYTGSSTTSTNNNYRNFRQRTSISTSNNNDADGSSVSSSSSSYGDTGSFIDNSNPEIQPVQVAPQPVPVTDAVLRPGEYIPNCGCVARGSCMREIGHYTRLVGHYSDVVCGYTFERCCFDGPCPGVLDEFVRAAPCVPQESCLRPYGILPTDVRDFGIIAPCPGHGAVRCIAVDDASLLEFQAAVAAIEASSQRFTAGAEVTTNELNVAAPIPVPIEIPAARVPVAVEIPTAPILVPVEVPAVAVEVPVVSKTTTVVEAEAESPPPPAPAPEPEFDLGSFLTSHGISTTGITSSVSQSVSTSDDSGETNGQITSVSTGTRPVSPTISTVIPAPAVIAPPASGFIGTSRLDCRSSGCYTPWAYRHYGGLYKGYPGLGFGFSSGFRYSKGFGYGF